MCKVGGIMAPFLEAFIEQTNKVIKPGLIQVLPEILMEGTVSETVQDTVRLGRSGGTVEV
jgi:hypothetical protein